MHSTYSYYQASDIAAVGTKFNVFSYDTIFIKGTESNKILRNNKNRGF